MKSRIPILLSSVWLFSVTIVSAQPLLSGRLTVTNSFLLSWPAPSSGFELQQAMELSAPAWSNTSPPVIVGGENQVAVTPSGDRRFFRLQNQSPTISTSGSLLMFDPAANITDVYAFLHVESGQKRLMMAMSVYPYHGARLAGSGSGHPTNPDDVGFSRLSIFGNDVLISAIQPGYGGGTIPGGWPNGRRFGDDIIDIMVSVMLSDLRGPIIVRVADGVDGVSSNSKGYNKVFPYEGTPHNGRNHLHP